MREAPNRYSEERPTRLGESLSWPVPIHELAAHELAAARARLYKTFDRVYLDRTLSDDNPIPYADEIVRKKDENGRTVTVSEAVWHRAVKLREGMIEDELDTRTILGRQSVSGTQSAIQLEAVLFSELIDVAAIQLHIENKETRETVAVS